jgi:hypothetical protein
LFNEKKNSPKAYHCLLLSPWLPGHFLTPANSGSMSAGLTRLFTPSGGPILGLLFLAGAFSTLAGMVGGRVGVFERSISDDVYCFIRG